MGTDIMGMGNGWSDKGGVQFMFVCCDRDLMEELMIIFGFYGWARFSFSGGNVVISWMVYFVYYYLCWSIFMRGVVLSSKSGVFFLALPSNQAERHATLCHDVDCPYSDWYDWH